MLAGTLLGDRYQLDQPIGSGGYSEVWCASDTVLSRSVAVKLLHPGYAHAVGSAPLTLTGTLLGTPGYLAPERASGAQATPATDLYALGIVAYECLAGAPPFAGTPLDVTLAHRDRPLPPLPADLPLDVVAFVMELAAKDPRWRPGSAGEVAHRAAHLRDDLILGAPVAPGPPRPQSRAPRPKP